MPGPQSFTPKPVKPSRPRKRFTVAQANKSLPLVQRIVNDIVKAHGDAMTCQQRLERIANGRGAKDAKEQQAAQAGMDSAMARLEDYVDELSEIGCELKDYQIGLIDFTGTHKGHDVCLCWKLGEPEVGFWHEEDAGVAGRQPIATLKEGE